VSLFHRRADLGITAQELIPRRPDVRLGSVMVTEDTALRHSAVWGCLRLRANLISTMPVDLYRRVNGVQVEVPKPTILVTPGGDRVDMNEWMYSTQFDLDRVGNTFGIITATDGLGLPARIDLAPTRECSVRVRKGQLTYKICGTVYQPDEVWHERQYTMSGLPVGLSPIAYAAWTIGEYLSIQEFALDWFGNGAVPAAHLKNTAKTLSEGQANETKRRFKAATKNHDVFVTGMDWEYDMIQAESAGNDWIEAKRATASEVCRYLDVPADLIDAATGGSGLTYANITQRNLEFLVMSLGPAIVRRENALSRLSSRPRYVKLNTDSLLRMDPTARAAMIKTQIDSRTLTPSEARELDERSPLTEADYAEFDRLFGSRNPAPTTPASPTTTPAPGTGGITQ
jgi:HK97 family phage portal protein